MLNAPLVFQDQEQQLTAMRDELNELRRVELELEQQVEAGRGQLNELLAKISSTSGGIAQVRGAGAAGGGGSRPAERATGQHQQHQRRHRAGTWSWSSRRRRAAASRGELNELLANISSTTFEHEI